ncbi:MAG: helix-turn-helix transcriptional regulator [Polyangiales bacterium]
MQTPGPFGALLRQQRTTRGYTQERLAFDAEVSTRHLSFLETGRASPSREMVLALGSALELPLRERNDMLLAAGYAPVYPASSFGADALGPVRRALDHLLAAHDPFGAVVVDRDWNALQINPGAARLFAWALPACDAPPEVFANVLRATLHPGGLRRCLVNFDEVAATVVDRLHRERARELDPARRAHLDRVLEEAGALPASGRGPTRDPVLVLHLRRGDESLRVFTTITTLGTPIDVTAQEIHIESYFAADEVTERWFRSGA